MRMRITSLDEKQLSSCVANNIWGSNRNIFNNWETGDILVFCINKEIAAAAKVSGSLVVTGEPIWDNGLFPWRLPLNFTHYFEPGNRIPFQGDIRDTFVDLYGKRYGYVFLNKFIIKAKPADIIWEKITSSTNNMCCRE